MQIKKIHFIFILLFLLITGCYSDSGKNPDVEKSNDKNISNKKDQQSSEGSGSRELFPYEAIKKSVFQTAKSLRDTWRMTWNDFLKDKISLIHIKENYLVSWAEDAVGESVLVVFQYQDNEWTSIYSNTFGRDILFVKLDTNIFGNDKPLIEVGSYYPGGMRKSNKVDFLMIDGKQVREIWELETALYESHTNQDDQMIYWNVYQTYSLIASHMQPSNQTNMPTIIVSGIEEKITMVDQKVYSKKEELSKSIFVWNENKKAFVEQKKRPQ